MALGDEKYLLLTTYKRDGTPVPTPVWAVSLDDGHVGFYTSSGSGKVKRLAHTADVLVQPCDARGTVREGTAPVEATATVVEGDDLAEITAKVKAKYGIQTTLARGAAWLMQTAKRNRLPYADRGIVITVPD